MYGYTHIKCILHLKCPVTESYVDVGKENMIKIWVFSERHMLTQRKILSNYFFEQILFTNCYTFWCHLLLFVIMEISLKNSKKKLWIFPIVKDDNISPGKNIIMERCTYIITYGNFVVTFLIKIFFECIIDIQKKFQKVATKTCFTESW